MLQNKYNKDKNTKTWEAFRKQRNLVTKLRRKSVNTYFIERCTGGAKSKDFWPTIKPFLTNKGSCFQKDIILNENNTLINKKQEICIVVHLTTFLLMLQRTLAEFYPG